MAHRGAKTKRRRGLAPDRTSETGVATIRAVRRRVLSFVVIFIALVIVGSVMELYVRRSIEARGDRTPAQQFAARAGGVLQDWIAVCVGKGLAACSIPSSVHGTTITVKSQVISVAVECTGIRATWIFWAGVLGFPCAWRSKVFGLLLGLFGVALLNMMRIAVLGIVAGYWPMSFETWHAVCMQGFLVVFVAPLWIAWMLWVVRKDAPTDDTGQPPSTTAPAAAS